MATTKKISELPDADTPLNGSEYIPIVQEGATVKTTPDDMRDGLAADGHTHTLADITDAGTAAGSAIEDFASAAQGALADTALQPADVGSAAYNDTGDFATAAQGALADTAVQPGDLETVATSGQYADLLDKPYPGLLNAIINGGCIISHRDDKTLDNTWQYGPVDLLAVKAEGTVSAGTVKQFTGAYTLTVTGTACMVEDATLDASGAVLFRSRIESRDARLFANQPAHFSARTYHDSGSTLDYIITVRKAGAEDDFSSTTDIDSNTIQVANDTNDTIEFAVADMGDCRHGIEIEVKIDCGAVTTKDFFMAEQQFSIGSVKQDFEFRPAAVERELVHRYLRPVTGLVAVANSASNMQVVLNHPGMRAAPSYEVTAALAFTDGYTADFTQSSAHIGTIHDNNKDHGRADIALFSGLTSGRFHIQRGMGGTILASAEL